jgi:membrane-associated phospholipid phosphatase
VHARTKAAVLGAGAGALLLALIWLAALHTGVGESADRAVFSGFAGLAHTRVNGWANVIANLCDPKPMVGFAALIVLVALGRRRPRLVLAALAVVLCANLTTELLKAWLPSSRVLPGALHPISSWPSGHATAAMSLALSAILVAPARLRPLVGVIGAAFAVAVGYSVLTLESHYPSDVLGGFLVAGTWTLLVVAALFWSDARSEAGRAIKDGTRLSLRAVLTPPAVGCGVAGILAALVALARPHQVLDYARLHEAFVVGAAAIGALGLLVVTALVLGMRR